MRAHPRNATSCRVAVRCWFASSRRVLSLALPALLWCSQPSPTLSAQRTSSLPTLTTVRAVSHLSAEEAARAYPVHLSGVVTYYDPHLANNHAALFFHDATGTLYVDARPGVTPGTVHAGTAIDLEGVSGPGGFSPIVDATKVTITGKGGLPPAPLLVIPRINTGDDAWMEVEGVVRSVEESDTLIKLQLALTDQIITAQTLREGGAVYSTLVDAKVRIRAIASPLYNPNRQIIGARLLFPDLAALQVVEPAPAPYELPLRPIDTLFRFRSGEAPEHRVHLRGNVTLQWPGSQLCIHDATGGICAQTTQTEIVPLGSSVDLVGFAVMGDVAPMLIDAVVRKTGSIEVVNPIAITADEAMRGKHNSQLVQIDGVIIGRDRGSSDTILVMTAGNVIYEAIFPKGTSAHEVDSWQIGSAVRLTGICVMLIDTASTARGGGLAIPKSFQIMLRSAADVLVLRRPSWWNTTHMLWILAIFAAAMVVVVVWVLILRNRVEIQTKTIRASEERFRELAHHDALTGLSNRLMLDERITTCLKLCREARRQAAILTIDIDRFKHINDTYGHPVGDECLKVVASRLRYAAAEIGTIARTGGEEFTLVLSGLRDREEADRIAHDILDLFRDPIVLNELEVIVSVSIGCALYPDDGSETTALRILSDQALYQAKRAGRSRVVFSTRELARQLEQANNIEAAIRESLRAGAFSLVYQPVYDVAGTVHRLEALLRTSDERLAPLGPATYVPIAESSGLIQPLGRWVLQEICRHIAAWRAAGLTVCPISVNISATQILQNGFSEDVLQILESYDLEPSVLEFELTETAAMTEFDAVASKIDRLARAGITFAIDDFGNGYSSIAHLHQLPLTMLKIDRAFVQKIEDREGTYTVMQAAIKMAQSLKMRALVKGVERPEQLALLQDLGSDLFQGFLLAYPMPASAVATLFAHKHTQNAARLFSVAS